MASTTRDLKVVLLRLRNGNPQAYDQFLSLYNDLTIDALKALSDAPSDQVLVQQGRTQQMRSEMRLFVEGGYPPEKKPEPEPPTPQ
jgi:hypothetical protein